MLSLAEPTHAHTVELWNDFLLLAPCVTVKVIAVWHLQASFLCMWMSVHQYSLCLCCLTVACVETISMTATASCCCFFYLWAKREILV